jgi:hypothetical protein
MTEIERRIVYEMTEGAHMDKDDYIGFLCRRVESHDLMKLCKGETQPSLRFVSLRMRHRGWMTTNEGFSELADEEYPPAQVYMASFYSFLFGELVECGAYSAEELHAIVEGLNKKAAENNHICAQNRLMGHRQPNSGSQHWDPFYSEYVKQRIASMAEEPS